MVESEGSAWSRVLYRFRGKCFLMTMQKTKIKQYHTLTHSIKRVRLILTWIDRKCQHIRPQCRLPAKRSHGTWTPCRSINVHRPHHQPPAVQTIHSSHLVLNLHLQLLILILPKNTHIEAGIEIHGDNNQNYLRSYNRHRQYNVRPYPVSDILVCVPLRRIRF